jgi:hypothetical protein
MGSQYGWLFSGRPDLPEGREQDWSAWEARVKEVRISAIQTIHLSSGAPGLLALIPRVERPGELGAEIGELGLLVAEEDTVLQKHLASANQAFDEFAQGFVWGTIRRSGNQWVETKLFSVGREWSAQQRAVLLGRLLPSGTTWDLVEQMDAATQENYWRSFHHFGLDDAYRERAVRKLLQYNRAYSAIEVLTLSGLRNAPMPATLIVEALEQGLRTTPEDDRYCNSFGHNVAQLLQSLEPSPTVNVNRIASLEWGYLRVVRLDRPPKFLHQEHSTNPEFFSDILIRVYRAEDEVSHEVSDEEQAWVMHGSELLESWRFVPGTVDGRIDETQLNTWMDAARGAAQAARRGVIADHLIGKMLSGAGVGEDGIWPAEAVRDVIERIASNDLENGLEIGRLSSRGVHYRNPADGGAEERRMAQRYETDAATLRGRWSRTASILRELAKTYRLQAQREDNQSELLGQLDA